MPRYNKGLWLASALSFYFLILACVGMPILMNFVKVSDAVVGWVFIPAMILATLGGLDNVRYNSAILRHTTTSL